MNLMPEPIPTRFVGKMYKVKEDQKQKNIKREDTKLSSPSSTEDSRPKSNSSTTGFPTALRAVGNVKIGHMSRKFKTEAKPDTSNLEKKSIAPTRLTPKGAAPFTKTSAGVAAFKTKVGFGGRNSRQKQKKKRRRLFLKI